MTEIRQGESQQELFGQFSEEEGSADRFAPPPKSQKPILLSTSIEQLILVGILSILALCLVFFLGLLRGRSLDTEGTRTVGTTLAVPAVPKETSRVALITPKVLENSAAAIDATRPYTLILVTYKKQVQAEREAAVLKNGGYPAYISAKGGYYVVAIGRYANGSEAKKDLKFFEKKYKGSYLIRR